MLVLSRRHGFNECFSRRSETTVFPIHITIVCPPESPLDFIDIAGSLAFGSVNRDEICEGRPCGERCAGVFGHVRSITMANAALGPPERTPGLVPSLPHSAFSAFPPAFNARCRRYLDGCPMSAAAVASERRIRLTLIR